MLVVAIEEAEPGMVLGVHVTHPQNSEHHLLKAGYVLDAPMIARLQDMGIGVLYIDYPGLEDLDQYLGANLSPARQAVYNRIKSTFAAVQKSANPTVGYADYYNTTRDLIVTLMQQGRHSVYIDQLSGKLGGDEVAHATAVAQLSLTLGIKLESYLIQQRGRLSPQHAKEVVNLGVAGMLHDLGKTKLPPGLQRYNSICPPEDDSQREQWESHAYLAYEMIRGGVEPSAAAAVLNHHQHYDGSGFPRIGKDASAEPFSGEKIHVFGRILLIADLYDRLAAGGKGRRPSIEVLHLMRTRYAAWIDPHVLQAFASVVPPFPPTAKVLLSDGTNAVVTGFNPADPYRPMVKRVAQGAAVGEAIDLALPGAPTIQTVAGVSVADKLPPS